MESANDIFIGEGDFGFCLSRVSMMSVGMLFAVKTFLAYFLWEELCSPPPAKPMTMVLTMILKLCFFILRVVMAKMNSE